MNRAWTLHVENFAKIESADICITPLMCFVGDNNSGKSTLGKELFPKTPSDSKTYRKCENWLKENKNRNAEITDDIVEMYIQWFNELLDIHKKELLHKIFNYEVEAEKIWVSGYTRKKKLEMQGNAIL